MKTLKTVLLLSLVISIAIPITIQAQSNLGVREHEGFFMRFLVGPGPGSIKLDDADMEFSSTGVDFHFQIGGSVSNNLILFGDIGGFSLTDPEFKFQGTTVTVEDLSVNALGFGGGLTYYLMPANIFFSGSIMYVNDTIEIEDEKVAESESGMGFFISAGKEWWVGDKWGLGAALFFEYGTPKDKEDTAGNQATLTNRIFGIMFSATMD